MRRLHLERHGPGARFLDLELSGTTTLDRTWGPLGRAPTGMRDEQFALPAQAERALDRQAARAMAKGYWAGHHEPGLVAAIAEDVDAEAGYLVYGDWLLERGDPRGELVHAPAENRAQLFEAHPEILKPRHWGPELHVEWWRGFARGLGVQLSANAWSALHVGQVLAQVVRHPSCQVLSAFALARPDASENPYLPNQRLHALFARALYALPHTVRRVGVSRSLAPVADEVLGGGGFELIFGDARAWITEAARAPRGA